MRVRNAVVFGGAIVSLMFTITSLGLMCYWAHTTGSWISEKVFDYEIWPPIGIAGVFFFTRIVDPIFEHYQK